MKLYKSAIIIISTNDTLSWIFLFYSASSLACIPQGPIILIPSQPVFALCPWTNFIGFGLYEREHIHILGDSSPICKRHLESMLKGIKSYLCLVQTGHVDIHVEEFRCGRKGERHTTIYIQQHLEQTLFAKLLSLHKYSAHQCIFKAYHHRRPLTFPKLSVRTSCRPFCLLLSKYFIVRT
jgi:hypothetical protein